MGHRTQIFRWTERVAFDSGGVTLGAAVHTLAARLMEITRNLSARMVDIDVVYGLSDDPTDEEVRFLIGLANPTVLPQSDTTLWSDWFKEHEWRSIGTDSGPIQLITPFESSEVDVKYANPDDGDGPMTVVATLFSNTTSNVLFRGHVTFDLEYKQHTYNDFVGSPSNSEEVIMWILNNN